MRGYQLFIFGKADSESRLCKSLTIPFPDYFCSMNKFLTGFQYFLLFATAVVIWQIFYPGLLSPDSVGQYAQARTGIFDDANPPLMSLVLRLVVKLGGDIGALIFLQCLAAIFGLRSIVLLSILLFSKQSISKQIAGIIATVFTILFLIPFLTPFMFFSVIFWKDAWLTIILLWVVSYLIWLFLNFDSLSRKNFIVHVLLLSVSASAIVIVRHNAIIIIPLICLSIAAFSRIKFGNIGLSLALPLLLMALTLNPAITYIFSVNHLYFGNTVLASDLKIMLKLYPELQPEYPLAARHQYAPILLDAPQGGVWDESIEGKPCPVIDCDDRMPQECYGTTANTRNIDGSNCYMRVGNDNKVLKNEYWNAVVHNPLQLASTKIYLFKQILHPKYWYTRKVAYDIYQNSFGLKPNEEYSGIRAVFTTLSLETGNKWYFFWISGIHLIWLIVNFLCVIYFLVKALTKRDKFSTFLILLFLIPFAYYLSYLLAATTTDYRFMYPSTLIMQVLTFALLISGLFKIFRNEALKS